MDNLRPKPVVLVVLDGYGIGPKSKSNAIFLAKKSNIDEWSLNYPSFSLQASGEAVGLSWGEMGNSEVGHLSLGSGRIIFQSLPRISRSITDKSFYRNQAFLEACEKVKTQGTNLQIMGLVSPGGIHSYNEHLYALLELAVQAGVPAKNIFVHAFLDGRDTTFNSAEKFIDQLQKKMTSIGGGRIATLAGRFYAMDRDNHWERVELAYRAMVDGESVKKFTDPLQAIRASYAENIFDEQLLPAVITEADHPITKISDGDAVIFFNFRADRAREMTKAFVLPVFDKFQKPRQYFSNLLFVTMTEYEKDLPVTIAFPPEVVAKPLAWVISEAGLKQLHIAETEKYAHVTFFFNGGNETEYSGEDRVIIDSARVNSYDEKPEMSAYEINQRLIQEIEADKYDFIVVNFANPDMVGHTGNLKATIKSVEIIDKCLGELVNSVLQRNGLVLITADHGNAERKFNEHTGEIMKEHSTSAVPLYIIGSEFKGKAARGAEGGDLSLVKASGVLADVAPTILKIMGLQRPEDMTGESLV